MWLIAAALFLAMPSSAATVNPCQYKTHMQPVVAAVSRYVEDVGHMDGAQARVRAVRITQQLTDVETRYGRPRGAQKVHALLVAALTDIRKAIYVRDTVHDLNLSSLYNYWIGQARASLQKARRALRNVYIPYGMCRLPRAGWWQH